MSEARVSEARVSEARVSAALSFTLQAAGEVLSAAEDWSTNREGEVRAAEQAVTEAFEAFEAAEDQTTKAADIFAVLEVAEQKVNGLLAGK